MSSKKGTYLPIRNCEEAEEQKTLNLSDSSFRWLSWQSIAIWILGIAQLFTIVLFLRARTESWHGTAKIIPAEYAQIEPLPTVYKRLRWRTRYSSQNDTEADMAWNDINTNHGFITMNREWATEHQWPGSLTPADDPSKQMYALNGYHQMHCLIRIRQIFFKSVRGEEPLSEREMQHVRHCLDALRQAVQCSADNTPLYSKGDESAGDGQLMRCRDWDTLRRYATRHTACYYEDGRGGKSGQPRFAQRFGHCDGGSDGLDDLEAATT